MTRNKRIAIVFRNLASLSGTPNTIFSHAQHLSGLGYQVDLIAEKIDRTRIDGRVGTVRIWRLPFSKKHRFTSFARRADRRLRARYDFIAGHGHNAVHDVVSLHNCERLCYLKLHGEEATQPEPFAAFQDRIFTEQQFTFCIANSMLMRDELVRRYRVPADRIRVIYPGYDAARFDPAGREPSRSAVRRELRVDDKTCLVGVVASGAFEVRGVDLAIDAFAALPAPVRARARMIVVGKASGIARYTEQVASHGLERQIEFVPRTREIERFYHALDICMHPARLETFGQVVQEAMACAVPVVTNRQVGVTELLSEAEYAGLPETSTVPALIAQLELLIGDERARLSLGQCGREAVRNNTLHLNCTRTLEVYREAGL